MVGTIDTMGQGDATLASIASWIIHKGRLLPAEEWRKCLSQPQPAGMQATI